MNKKLVMTALGLAIATLATPSFAQFGGLGKALGGGGAATAGSNVSAESLVQSYVAGTNQVVKARVNLLTALNKKDLAEAEALAAKNMTEGPTKASLEGVAQLQTEDNKAFAAALKDSNVVLDDNSKKLYAAGLVDLVKGIKAYTGMAGDVKNFKPSLTSIGGAATAAVFVIKTMPGTLSTLKETLQQSIAFAKANNLPVPAEATSLI
jgi:hypothetical protein